MKKFILHSILLTYSAVGLSQIQKVKVESTKNLVSTNAATKSNEIQAEFIGFRNTPSTDLKWQPNLTLKISDNESESNELLEKIKKVQNQLKFSSQSKSTLVGTENGGAAGEPILGTNFNGIDNSGTNQPLDNTIAIANNGNIVTCVNSKIEYRNASGAILYSQSLENFINDNTLSTNLCDPKVLYDSGADRFIFFCQTCDGDATTSKIVIGFSSSNNPNAGFYLYKLTGNPYNDNSWFDYPKMAVSTNELIITGNLFGSNNGPFKKAVIYQIPKTPGFSGGSFNYQTWSNLNGNPFTILPVSNGQQGNYGPGIYMVSTDAVTNGSTKIYLYDLTNEMSASNEQIIQYTVTTSNYKTGGDAGQQGGSKLLNTGDCRALDGFYLNGIIHFVFHSDIGSGYNGINYNRLNIANSINISSTFGAVGTHDYCFPAVASVATTPTNKSVIISFSRSGVNSYPEIRAVSCDDNMNWSNSTPIKQGTNFISYSWSTTSTERWGDYSGICRKYNSNPPEVWAAGDYANSQKYWGQWIAELTVPPFIGVKETEANVSKPKVFPNPIVDTYKVEFNLKMNETIQIEIYDAQGKLVKELYKGRASSGTTIFTFNKSNLSSGTYFLTIKSSTSTLKYEKISVN